MKRFIILLMLAVPATLIIASCDKTETTPITPSDPLDEYTLIGQEEATTLGYTIKLYAPENVFVGFNQILVRITNNDVIVEDATVTFKPMMNMPGMQHSCPSEQPIFNTSMKVYEGTTTFIMPSSAMADWTLEVVVKDNQGAEEMVNFTLNVIEKAEKVFYSFVSDADSTQMIFVALLGPLMPDVGINDYEIVIYERQSMMSFPPVETAEVEIEPIMPSMGHGSPNNVNPTHVGNGHYVGKVNFTMTGYWRIDQVIQTSSGDIMNDSGYFDITL